MSMRLGDDKGKKIARDYFTGTPNVSSSVEQTENPQYGMPPNYFVGQSPPLAHQFGPRRPNRPDRSSRPVRSCPGGWIGQTSQTGAKVVGSAS